VTDNLHSGLGFIADLATAETRADGLWVSADEGQLISIVEQLRSLGGRLSTITGVLYADSRFTLLYHFVLGSFAINLRLEIEGNSARSLTSWFSYANWIEREIHDLYGLVFVGHPNLDRLLRPARLEAGFWRRETGPESRSADIAASASQGG
jgi:NADH:ubiquinone oxidoreductase subunit C